jgi:hypothetical protein
LDGAEIDLRQPRATNTKVCHPHILQSILPHEVLRKAFGYGDPSTKIWKLYGGESEKYYKALVDNWMGNTDSMLIFVRSIYLILTPT